MSFCAISSTTVTCWVRKVIPPSEHKGADKSETRSRETNGGMKSWSLNGFNLGIETVMWSDCVKGHCYGCFLFLHPKQHQRLTSFMLYFTFRMFKHTFHVSWVLSTVLADKSSLFLIPSPSHSIPHFQPLNYFCLVTHVHFSIAGPCADVCCYLKWEGRHKGRNRAIGYFRSLWDRPPTEPLPQMEYKWAQAFVYQHQQLSAREQSMVRYREPVHWQVSERGMLAGSRGLGTFVDAGNGSLGYSTSLHGAESFHLTVYHSGASLMLVLTRSVLTRPLPLHELHGLQLFGSSNMLCDISDIILDSRTSKALIYTYRDKSTYLWFIWQLLLFYFYYWN